MSMNIKRLSRNLSLSLIALSFASGAYAQNNGQLKKDFAAALQVSEAEVDPILQRQADAMALAGKLEKAIPDDYAGMRLNPSKNFSATIYLKSGDPSVIRFRGQSLTGDSDLDSRLTFGGSLGRADWRDRRGMGSDRAVIAA